MVYGPQEIPPSLAGEDSVFNLFCSRQVINMAISNSNFNERLGTRLITILLICLLFCSRPTAAQSSASSPALSNLTQCSVRGSFFSSSCDTLSPLSTFTCCGASTRSVQVPHLPDNANALSLLQTSCLLEGVSRSGCMALDTTCQCSSAVMKDTTFYCVLANCTMQDSLGESLLFFYSRAPLSFSLSTSRGNETRTRSISRVLPSLSLPFEEGDHHPFGPRCHCGTPLCAAQTPGLTHHY